MRHSWNLCLADWSARDSYSKRVCVSFFLRLWVLFIDSDSHFPPNCCDRRALFRHWLSITVIRCELTLVSSSPSLSAVLVDWLYTDRAMQNTVSGRVCSLTLSLDSLYLVVSRTTFPQSLWHSRVQCVDRRPSCQRKEFLLYRTTSSSLISWRFDS